MKEKFTFFCRENPFGFTEEQLHKIQADILKSDKRVVTDEYIDFLLWTKGLQSRQQYFATYLEKILPISKYRNLLEVGCGRNAALAKMLAEKGYCMTAMDPQLTEEDSAIFPVIGIRDSFVYDKVDLQEYDAVIAQEPCDATEHIVRACLEQRKNYVISLCGTAHRLINGEMPKDAYAWFEYLQQIVPDNSVLIYPDLIPGYLTPVLMGMFRVKETDEKISRSGMGYSKHLADSGSSED